MTVVRRLSSHMAIGQRLPLVPHRMGLSTDQLTCASWLAPEQVIPEMARGGVTKMEATVPSHDLMANTVIPVMSHFITHPSAIHSFCSVGDGTEALYLLGKCSVTEPHPTLSHSIC
jgi:hypothetical protein